MAEAAAGLNKAVSNTKYTSRARFERQNLQCKRKACKYEEPSAVVQFDTVVGRHRDRSLRQLHFATKGHCMSTTVAIDTWVKRLAADERMRDAIRLEEDETASRRADLVRRNGQRLIDELRAVVIRDVEAFRAEFPEDRSRDVVVAASGPDGGFVVSKPARAAASLTVTPNLDAAAIVCHFRFMLSDGLPPREDRFDVTFAAGCGDPLLMRHNGTGQVFATPEVLSEFLLVPVLTGRCR
jgi:hypothetical protein